MVGFAWHDYTTHGNSVPEFVLYAGVTCVSISVCLFLIYHNMDPGQKKSIN